MTVGVEDPLDGVAAVELGVGLGSLIEGHHFGVDVLGQGPTASAHRSVEVAVVALDVALSLSDRDSAFPESAEVQQQPTLLGVFVG